LVIDNAETFVTEHRAALEKYITAPSQVGVLILDVKTFPETTKLAKALPDNAKISCKAPSIYKLHELESWAMAWSQSQHGKKLTHDAAHELVERIGPAMGLIDAELEKLATSIGSRTSISPEDVEKYVGRSRGADVFQILNAVGDGQPNRAFEILGQLLNDNEEPMAILGALTHSLRKLAAVGELIALGHSLGPAMDQANVPKWPKARQEFEKQLRHLGRNRLLQLLDWLIEINMGLKGGNPLPPRLQLEMLLAKLARPTK
jgi:DNA polymerase III subunit delta